MSKPTIERRVRMQRDFYQMRRTRRRYVCRYRQWLEQDRERIYELIDRIKQLGLLAQTTDMATCLCSVLGVMAGQDGHETSKLRNRWLMKTGWSVFWGYQGTKAYRNKMRKENAA